jgi:hypothetical protein
MNETETWDCTICGANINPSSRFPWHYLTEDCRSIREPVLLASDALEPRVAKDAR